MTAQTRDWSEELTAYIDGELDPEAARALEAQLANDVKLKALEQQLRRTVSLMAAVPMLEPSSSLRRSVLSKVDQPTLGERVRSFLTPGRLVPVGVIAMASVATFVVLTNGRDAGLNEEQLFLAQNMEVVEDLDLVGLERADDFDVVASLHELKEGEAP